MLDPAVVKASYYCDAIMTPCLCKVVMFSQITRCTVDFWHDTSFSHFPFLRHLHSLTIAAGAHFPTKWFTFCHFTRVQLAEGKKKSSMQSSSAEVVTQVFNRTWWKSWAVVIGVGARSNVFISFHTNVFFLLHSEKRSMGNHWYMPHYFLSIDFGADLWNDTESKYSIWEEMPLRSKQGAGFHSWLCYSLAVSLRLRLSFMRWFS